MNPRIRRLRADYEKVKTEIPENEFIRVEPAGPGVPPERYLVTFRVPGLRWDAELKRAIVAHEHKADIYLHSGYPRQKPRCVLLSPIWHPNFGKDICIGDHWAAGETLVDVIVQIADMIQYKVYNTKSPLNKAAARWAEKNRGEFPVGRVDILVPGDGGGSAPQAGKTSVENELDIQLGPVTKDDMEIELR